MLLVYAIIETRSCSLYKCAEVLPGTATFDSGYKRLLRFIRLSRAEQFCLCVSRFIVALLPEQEAYYVAIDRTNWKLGTRSINVLCVGILIWERCYIPLLWEPLACDGNSVQAQRIALLNQLITLWPESKQLVVLGDREFIGRTWIQWLNQHHMGMVIRVRKNDYLDEVADSLGIQEGFVPQRIRNSVRQNGYFITEITLAGCLLYYVAFPDAQHAHKQARFITHSPDPQWVFQAYGRRWCIEVFFKCVKTDGFNLEDLSVTEPDRVRMMVAAVSFAYVLAVHQGQIEQTKKPAPIKKNKKTGRRWPSVSVFRLGYRWLRRRIRTFNQMIKYISLKLRRTIQENLIEELHFT